VIANELDGRTLKYHMSTTGMTTHSSSHALDGDSFRGAGISVCCCNAKLWAGKAAEISETARCYRPEASSKQLEGYQANSTSVK
jgi:hypothetical protein